LTKDFAGRAHRNKAVLASLVHLLFLEQPGDYRLDKAAREFIEQLRAFRARRSFLQPFF
jgi:hypothetical protein